MTTKKRSKPRAVWVGFDKDHDVVWYGHSKRVADWWVRRVKQVQGESYPATVVKYVREVKKK